MKKQLRLLSILFLIVVTFSFSSLCVNAEENMFPEGVKVVPQGTEISIDDDAGTVAIYDYFEEISEGD